MVGLKLSRMERLIYVTRILHMKVDGMAILSLTELLALGDIRVIIGLINGREKIFIAPSQIDSLWWGFYCV